jgi:hypothetical protein
MRHYAPACGPYQADKADSSVMLSFCASRSDIASASSPEVFVQYWNGGGGSSRASSSNGVKSASPRRGPSACSLAAARRLRAGGPPAGRKVAGGLLAWRLI